MRQKSGPVKEPAEKVVKDIRRATRKQYSAEEKIRIVLDGLRGESLFVIFRSAFAVQRQAGTQPGALVVVSRRTAVALFRLR
jgi:transposase